MHKDNIGIALIGCGNMGNYYAYNLSKMENITIVSCCDPSKKKLDKFREKWNIASGTTDWRDLFLQEKNQQTIDGIINCSVDKLHGDVFKSCIDSNIALLTEKPFALPLETLNSLNPESLVKHNFVINFSKRCIPAIASAADFLKKEGLGRIHRMELHYRQGWVLNYDYGDWHDSSAWFWRLSNEISHHGILGDLGSHLFDLATYFCGPVSSIFCSLNRIEKGCSEYKGQQLNSPDDASCLLQMQNGASVLVNASRTVAGEKDSLEILISGDKGSIRILPEESKDSYSLFTISSARWEKIPCPRKAQKNMDSLIKLIGNEDTADYPGIREALYSDSIIRAAMESADKESRISINASIEKNLGEKWLKIIQ